MNRVFIIGAGFSKAVADAPLASELIAQIYEKALNDHDDRPQRHRDLDSFLKVLKKLNDDINCLINFLINNGIKIESDLNSFLM